MKYKPDTVRRRLLKLAAEEKQLRKVCEQRLANVYQRRRDVQSKCPHDWFEGFSFETFRQCRICGQYERSGNDCLD